MRGGTGRKKVEIKKREKAKERMVTFSKRRKGLFKKVSELHSKTAAKAAVAVLSPGGRTFTHGEPSFDSVVDLLEKAIGQESNILLEHSHPHPGSALINVTGTLVDVDHEEQEEEEEASESDTAKKWLESLEFDEYDDEEEVESFLTNLQELERKLEQLQFYQLVFA